VVALPDPSSLSPTALYAGVSPVSAAGMMPRHSFLPRGRERVAARKSEQQRAAEGLVTLYSADHQRGPAPAKVTTSAVPSKAAAR
jgi:hypothetical protein